MLFAIHMIDRPGAESLRAELSAAHLGFVGPQLDTMYAGGPLLADDGETIIGSLIIKDFADRDEAEAWISDEPYTKGGLFESVTIRAFRAVAGPS